MEYKKVQIGCYETDIQSVFEIWAAKIIDMRKQGMYIETETKKEERWRMKPGDSVNSKSRELHEWGVKALYPITYVYEIKKNTT